MTSKNNTLADSLEHDDWGLIISPTGELKGVYIPQAADHETVPDAIVEILEKYYGIDFYEDDVLGNFGETPKTVH